MSVMRGEGWRSPQGAARRRALKCQKTSRCPNLTLDRPRSARRCRLSRLPRDARTTGLEFAAKRGGGRGRARCCGEPAPGATAPHFEPPVLVVAVPDLSAQAGFIADRFFGAAFGRGSSSPAITGHQWQDHPAPGCWPAARQCAGPELARTWGRWGSGLPGQVRPGSPPPRPERGDAAAPAGAAA